MKNSASFNSDLSKFGIGLFETIKVEKYPIDLDLHMDRMFNSIKELNINIQYSKEFLKNEILKYIYINDIENKALRLTVFDEGYNISIRDIPYNNETYEKGFKLIISPIKRGNSIIYKHKTTNYYESIYSKRYAIRDIPYNNETYEKGFKLIISPIKRGNSIIYKHKTTNYYESIYSKRYANERGFDDGLFVDTDGKILECSMSNIFFIKGNCIYTPSSNLPILNGIMKKRILDICGEMNIPLVEKNIKIRDIADYDFVFVTNSLMNVMKVTQIEDIFYETSNDLFDKIVACI